MLQILYNNRRIGNLPLIIASGGSSNLIGNNWFEALGIRIEGVFTVNSSTGINSVLRKFEHLFSSELGRYSGPRVSLQIKLSASPIRLPRRAFPALLGIWSKKKSIACVSKEFYRL